MGDLARAKTASALGGLEYHAEELGRVTSLRKQAPDS